MNICILCNNKCKGDQISMLTKIQSDQLQLLADCVSKRQLTQQELARATGVDQSQISRILAGHARRASQNVLKLCKYAEGLDTFREVESGHSEAVADAMRALLGCSVEEDQKLLDIVTSLKAWRESWQAKR